MSRKIQVPPAVGDKFDKWEVVGLSDRLYHVLCRCICGTEKHIPYRHLYARNSKSCLSCARRSHKMSSESKTKLSANKIVHGHRRRTGQSLTYSSWCMMLARCENTKFTEYHRYGDKGVTVCERWHDFSNFLADMGDRPSVKHSIDRYPDNSGNYEPSNCRWATSTEQNRNKSSNRLITMNDKTQPLAAWLEELGVKRYTFNHRTRVLGWTEQQALLYKR